MAHKQHEQHQQRQAGFVAELKDAVTPRAALLVIGVLALQLGFIASYLGAFHAPSPHRIPVAVVAPAGAPAGTAQSLTSRFDAIPGHPLRGHVYADQAAATRAIKNRKVDGALIVGTGSQDSLLVASAGGGSLSAALTTVVQQVDAGQHRTVTVTDVVPADVGDARGLSAFYLVVGWVVGGYLVASILAVSAGSRPANRNRAVIRLGSLALYSVASGIGGVLIGRGILGAVGGGSVVALCGFGTLLVFGVGAFTMAAQVLLDTLGIGLAILLFVILGNPSAGGAYPKPLLPPFWAAIGPWLPPGAGTSAVRGITYFGGAGVAGPVWVLVGYAVVGVAVTVAGSGMVTPAGGSLNRT
jgi:hypothetical protein